MAGRGHGRSVCGNREKRDESDNRKRLSVDPVYRHARKLEEVLLLCFVTLYVAQYPQHLLFLLYRACSCTGSTNNLLWLSDSSHFSHLPCADFFEVFLPNKTNFSSCHSIIFLLPSSPTPLVAHDFEDSQLHSDGITL